MRACVGVGRGMRVGVGGGGEGRRWCAGCFIDF